MKATFRKSNEKSIFQNFISRNLELGTHRYKATKILTIDQSQTRRVLGVGVVLTNFKDASAYKYFTQS